MSSTSDLIAAGPATTPFDIVRAAYAELHVTDLGRAREFYVGLLGMVVTADSGDTIYLRGWEERLHHSLVIHRAPVAAAVRLAFRVRSPDDLAPIEAHFAERGCRTEWAEGAHAGMGKAIRAWDPSGYPLEFFYEMEQFETQLQRFDLQHGAPVLRIDHFNLHTPRVEETFAFWAGLGFRCSEYIVTDDGDERLTGAWLLRKPTVHDVALTAGRGPRLHHLGWTVPDTAAVLRACDQLAAAGHTAVIERGPGRHGVSNAFFVYLRDPDGHRIELYACDYYTGDPDHQPIRWSVNDPRCRTFWGARTPDSWYEESSLVLGPDGEPAEIHEAGVDERAARSDVIA